MSLAEEHIDNENHRMTLYPQTTTSLTLWPEPIEIGYQLLGGGDGSALAPKLNHLGIADLLFMSSIMLVPRERRPWGIATWLADVFDISRPTLYSLPKRVMERLAGAQPVALRDDSSLRQLGHRRVHSASGGCSHNSPTGASAPAGRLD